MGESSSQSLRERTRHAVRDELMRVALDLFRAHGYAETTVDEIAAAAGMSKRSFFRYFTSKEAVVLGGLERIGELLAARLAQLPAELPAWPALRATLEFAVEYRDNDPERGLAELRLRSTTPALNAYYLEQVSRWPDAMIPHLAGRLPDDGTSQVSPPDLRPRAMIGAALACLHAAETAWLASDGSVQFSALLDLAMGAMRPL
jgi:AcrR family transcriptional regulator